MIPAMPPKTGADRSAGLKQSDGALRGCLLYSRDEIPLALYQIHLDSNLKRTVDFTILHEISPYNALLSIVFRSLGILGKIKLQRAQDDPLHAPAGGVFLHDLELDIRLLQVPILVDGQTHGSFDLMVVGYFMVFDVALGGAAAVLCSYGVREVPFYG